MKNITRKLIISAIALSIAVTAVPAVNAFADDSQPNTTTTVVDPERNVKKSVTVNRKEKIPTKIRTYPSSNNSYIYITLADQDAVLDQSSIKASNSSIKTKVIGSQISYSVSKQYDDGSTSAYAQDPSRDYTLAYSLSRNDYVIKFSTPAKEGKYSISFDILRGADATPEKHTVTIYNYKSPIKSWSVNGLQGSKRDKYASNYKHKSGKVKVTLDKGYKLKKLENITYTIVDTSTDSTHVTKESQAVYTPFSNGANIRFNNVGSYYREFLIPLNATENPDTANYYNEYYSYDKSEDTRVPREIRITYTDKYTKEDETTTLSLGTCDIW